MTFTDLPIHRTLALLSTTDELTTLAGTLAANPAPSPVFTDQKNFQEILSALPTGRHMLVACLYHRHEALQAQERLYQRHL